MSVACHHRSLLPRLRFDSCDASIVALQFRRGIRPESAARRGVTISCERARDKVDRNKVWSFHAGVGAAAILCMDDFRTHLRVLDSEKYPACTVHSAGASTIVN